ncbi:MAG: polysaccharide deacetylase family protein [Candidatus Omnitrophota bacterium]|jgi:peptidoglycan/xylan/chitin deacetylase (PgdA/CDA1 family)
MFKKRKLLISVFALAIIFLASSAVFIYGKYVPPILMYHSVTPDASPGNRLAVTPQTFERQMNFLKSNNYNILPLESLAELIKEGKRVPHKTVSITFDDGYKDNYEYAFPILKKYGIPATLFVIIEEVGRHDRVSWGQVKEMQDSGIFTIGSHTIGPEPLINISSEAEIKRQIFDSKRILEKELGRQVSLFSYPEGRFNGKIRQLVIDAGYKCAVATNPGKDYPDDDIFALKRLRISSNAGNLFILWAETNGYYNFMREHRHK